MANRFRVGTLILSGQDVTAIPNALFVNGVNVTPNVNGLISTGSADLRYLATGASGQFYQKSNPNNFSSSGNVESTGTSLQNQLGNYYLKTNPNNFISSGDHNAKNSVTGVSITGGVGLTGAININAGSNITLKIGRAHV